MATALAQAIAHLVENFIKVRPGAIHLVYKGYPRHLVPIRPVSIPSLIAAAPAHGAEHRTPSNTRIERSTSL